MADKQIKDDFIASWDDMLPDGVKNFAETAIPELLSITALSTVDEAIIAQGILAYNLNLILKQFEGFTLIDLILHIGQKNAVNKAIMLASLEYVDKGGEWEFSIVAPSPPEEYIYTSGSEIGFVITISMDVQEAVQEISYSCAVQDSQGGDPIDVPLTPDEENPEQFGGVLTINTPDTWTAAFSVTFDGFEVEQERLFEVQ
jgi:hypothetical protein